RAELAHIDLRTPLMIVAGVVLLGAIATLFLPERPTPAPEATEPEPFDAFAHGYPVPPLPGQELGPSPRAARRAAAAREQAAGTAVLLEQGTSDDDTADEKESDDV